MEIRKLTSLSAGLSFQWSEIQKPFYFPVLVFLTTVFINFSWFWYVINPNVLMTTSSTFFINNFMSYFLQLLNAFIICTIFIMLTTATPVRHIINNIGSYFMVFCFAPLQTLVFISIYKPDSLAIQLLTIIFSLIFFLSALIYFRDKQDKFFLKTMFLIIGIVAYIELPNFLNSYLATVLNNAVYNVATITNINLLLFIPLVGILGFIVSPRVSLSLAKDARYLRVFHYQLMMVLGLTLAMRNNPYDVLQIIKFSPDILLNFLFCSIALGFACLYAIVINNLSDVDIDSVCNQQRPLIQKAIPSKLYLTLGYVFLSLALIYALMADGRAFLIISMFMGNYYIYSCPPLRVKRLTVLSKLIISINSIALCLLGYLLVNGEIEDFPIAIYFIYLIFFTIASNVIDLKDVIGDRLAGVLTLPVLIGLKKAKAVIGVAAFMTAISFMSVVDNNYLLIPMIAIGVLQFYLINKSNFNELPVLIVSNVGIIFLIIYIFAEKTILIK